MDFIQQVGSLALGSRLRRVSDQLFQDVADIYQELGVSLNPRFFPLFYLIHTQGAQNITGAAKKLAVSHPAISKTAAEMLKEQLLCKTVDPQDERRQLLTLGPVGKALLTELEPVWTEIRLEIQRRLAQQQHNLLKALDEFEFTINTESLARNVIERCEQNRHQQVDIIDWDPSYREYFYELNMQWLQQYFAKDICPRDIAQLKQPETYYLAKGGIILFAKLRDQIVGCCALEFYNDQTYYLTKTAVSPNYQNKGIGRQLVLAALDKVRKRSAKEVCLETASQLQAANHLYRQLGFVEVEPPGGELEFDRTDTFMSVLV